MEYQRASRLGALADLLVQADEPNLAERDAGRWFADVSSADVQQVIKVLKLAEAYEEDCTPADWRTARPTLAIILTSDGKLLLPNKVVLAPPGATIPDRATVALELCKDEEAKRILEDVLKVSVLDDRVWLSVLADSLSGIPDYGGSEPETRWMAFWEKLRIAPESVRDRFIAQNKHRIRVRRRDEAWVLANAALLPGSLIPLSDTSENQKLLVDLEFHKDDKEILNALGVSQIPSGIDSDRHLAKARSLESWLSFNRQAYRDTHENAALWDYLEPLNLMMPCGWWLLPLLHGHPKANLTQLLLKRISEATFSGQIKFGHITVTHYPKIDVAHPLPWLLLTYGTMIVAESSVRLAAIAKRRKSSALDKIDGLRAFQPLFERFQDVQPSVTVSDLDIRDMWQALITALATPAALSNDSLRDLWAEAAHDKVVPTSLPSNTGGLPISQVFVTGSADLARRARTPNRVVATLDNHALQLWIEQGARPLDELMKPVWSEPQSPESLLVSVMPELAEVLRPEFKNSARCQSVSELQLLISESSQQVPCLMWKNTLLLDMQQLVKLARADRFRLLLNETAAAGWLSCDPAAAARQLGDAHVDKRRQEVACGGSLAERLLLAVGKRPEPLRTALGDLADLDFLTNCQPLQLAELILAQLGPATLAAIKDTLEAEGLKPPARWNTAEARAFVASIGFPEEFAASPTTRREAEEFISGPIDLPPLHDFQMEVLEGITTLLTTNTPRRRAVISLPTGGGKTRVIVEAAVLLVLKPVGDSRIVVWVAQTDELCEQAVQAFRQVWVNLGAKKTDLRIIRLWGGNPNPAIQDLDKPLVVVASIQTLNSRMGTVGLAWLQRPGLVVVDECHHAITPSYTNLLRWLDAEVPQINSESPEEPPIIGLSATPFRTDDDESRRLAKRFDKRWFPADQERLHLRLRSQGVLSQAEYEALKSGVGLLPEEIEQLGQLSEPWEGLDFENLLERINQRLAGSKKRNEQLVERIRRSVERSILFFANSVLHAQEMSARLNLAGIPAAAISGDTPVVARRYFLERFQRGDIRVLCNHSVLTTGFDAPKTDMVLISRQVFSPVRYMQMVGRGLRGEKNGGTAQCRIVTVVDNLGRFQDRHPYHYCQQYFTEMAGGALTPAREA